MKEFNFIEKQINEKLLQKKQLKSQSNQIFNKMSPQINTNNCY